MARRFGPDRGTSNVGPHRSKYRTLTQTQEYEDIEYGWCPRQVCDMWFDFNGPVQTYTLAGQPVLKTSNADTNKLGASNGDVSVAKFVVPRDGVLLSATLVADDTETANDTNYQTFALTNLLGAGSGSTAMLAATDANTTKATGGSTLTANVPRTLTLNGTAANLRVNAGDVLEFTATATQTPTVSDAPRVQLVFQTIDFGLTPVSARTAGSVLINEVANTANGEINFTLSATNEVNTGGFTFGDQLCIPATRGVLFEALVKFTSGGTSSGLASNERLIAGLCTAYNATWDNISRMAWFRVEASGLRWDCEADDNTTDTDDQSTGVTATASTYNLLRIDMGSTGAIEFWIDDNLVGTIAASALAATDLMQMIIAVQKASGTGTPSLTVDWCRAMWERS